jgi:hypothetical protein
MPSKPMELTFPLRGINENWAFGRQLEGTCPDAQNCIPFDTLDSRARGGQRWGTSKYYTDLHNGANDLQRITSLARMIANEVVEPFTAANGEFYTLFPTTWDHYYSTTAGSKHFDAVITTDAVSPEINTNRVRFEKNAIDRFTSHISKAVRTPIGAAYTVSLVLDVDFNVPADEIDVSAWILFRVNPTYNNECWEVFIGMIESVESRFILRKRIAIAPWRVDYDFIDVNAAAVAAIEAGTTVKFEIASDGEIELFVNDVSQGTFIQKMDTYENYTRIGFGGYRFQGAGVETATWYIDDFTVTGVQTYSARDYRIVAVSGGDVYLGLPAGILAPASGGTNVVATSGRIDMQGAYGKVYLCDGVNANYSVLDLANDTVSAWTPDSGSLPSSDTNGCSYITLYRGRIIMAGLVGDPHNWFMSAVNDPLNWDYGATVSATMAVAGNNTDAGECPDIITCFAPYSDDLLFIGGDHTVWLIRGDPADRGRIDNISYQTGISGPDAYAFDPNGIFYFFGSGAIWRMAAGGVPEPLSRNRMDQIFGNIDLTTTAVHLAWDNVRHGLFIFVVPSAEGSAIHYYWDERSDSFWKVILPNAQGPTTVHAFDGDDPDDTALLLGGFDGYIRFIDPTSKNDDGTAISSYVLYPPIAAGGPLRNTRFTGATAVLDTESDDVILTAYAEDTVQKTVESATSDEAAVNITGVSIVNKTFTVAEDWSARAAGDRLLIAGSTGNDGSHTLASLTGAGPTVLTVVGTIADATVDGTIQYQDRAKFIQTLSARRTRIMHRIAGNAIMLKLSNSVNNKTWAIENLIANIDVTGRTRKNQL